MNGNSEDLEKRKKKFSIIQWIISVLVVIILGCCSYAAIRYYTADREMLGQNADQMVSIAGSINRFLKPVPDWHRISERAILTHEEFAGIDGSGETVPITAELARQYSDISDAQLWDYIGHHGTDKAYENLILGKENNLKWYEMPDQKEASHPVSLIFVTAPSAEEYEKADAEGVSLEAEPVALDGFVFITHKDNPVDSLSLQQIRDIYAGRITNWKEVGAKLLFLHFNLSSRADLDNRDTTCKLSKALLKFFLIKIGGGCCNLISYLRYAVLNGGLIARTVNDYGILLCNLNLTGAA